MPPRKRRAAAPPSRASAAPRASEIEVAAGAPREVAEVGRAGAPAQGRELRARGKRTMRNLLDAGIDVFSTRGFHAARVDDIVKAAKTSHGTFYLYFSSKEDLFQALVADVASQLAVVTESLGPVTPNASGRAELRAWLERFSETYERYGPIIRTWTEAEVDTSEAGRMGTGVLGDLAAGVAARIPASRQRSVDPAIASLAVIAMIERFNYFVLSGQIDANREELLDTLTSITFDALFT